MNSLKSQKGQALLVILLVMALGLTIGLAVISRSVTDIKISQQQEESARALSVAEAGIEESLKLGAATDVQIQTPSGLVTATVEENPLGSGTEFVFPKGIEAGDIQTVWLVEHSGEVLNPSVSYQGNSLEVYWGNEDTGTSTGSCDDTTIPALEATLIYKDSDVYKLARYAFDPDVLRKDCNNFDLAESGSFTVGGKKFKFKATLSLLSGTKYALRLRILYAKDPHNLGVKRVGTATLPSQGKCYESTAIVLQSGITRKIQQCQFYKAPPAIFDYVLYSEENLVK